MKYAVLVSVAILAVVRVASASDELLGWDTASLVNCGPSPWGPTSTISSGLTSLVGLTRGSGMLTGTTSVPGWGGHGFQVSSESDAVDRHQYFTFGFTVATGYSVSLSSIGEAYRRGTHGADSGALQFSLDGGANFTDAASLAFSTFFATGDTLSGDLSQVAALQNLAAGTTVVFREPIWYASGTPVPSENWFVYDFAAGNDLSLYGTVSAASGGGALVGDINQDHIVDSRDIGVMLGALANIPNYASGHGMNLTQASAVLDVNQDSKVSNADLQWLLNHLKTGNGTLDTVPLDTVPEPSSFLLGAIGGVAVLGIRRRCREKSARQRWQRGWLVTCGVSKNCWKRLRNP